MRNGNGTRKNYKSNVTIIAFLNDLFATLLTVEDVIGNRGHGFSSLCLNFYINRIFCASLYVSVYLYLLGGMWEVSADSGDVYVSKIIHSLT